MPSTPPPTGWPPVCPTRRRCYPPTASAASVPRPSPKGEETTIGKEKSANSALTADVETFVADLLAGLEVVPAYYAHMGPANAAGPAPLDLTPPALADAEDITARLAAGEWVVDLRNRVAFAEGHVAGSFNFEADGKLAAYLAWLIPWGKPVALLPSRPWLASSA